MDTKLTLKLNSEVIEKAKLYALHQGVSLSRVVESYFLRLTRDEKPPHRELTGVVAELAGILEGREIDDSRKGYAEYLTHKYS